MCLIAVSRRLGRTSGEVVVSRADGKEGVDGSSPSEGFANSLLISPF